MGQQQETVRQTADGSRRRTGRSYFRRLCVFGAVVVFLAIPFEAQARSTSALIRHGNSHFAEGRYEDAEKAYREALVKAPGTPEILYNLGNALIMQGSYDHGIAALGRVIDGRDAKLRQKSFYNIGNALYLMGRFGEAAASFTQAVKLDPGDLDAKHNLELALMRLHPQRQDEAAQSPPSPADQSLQPANDYRQRRAPDDAAGIDGDRRNVTPQKYKPDFQDATPGATMSREEIERLLDAFHHRETELQRRLHEQRERHDGDTRDW